MQKNGFKRILGIREICLLLVIKGIIARQRKLGKLGHKHPSICRNIYNRAETPCPTKKGNSRFSSLGLLPTLNNKILPGFL